jgi:superkiller protein 3
MSSDAVAMALRLKEAGNSLAKEKKYRGALEQYNQAIAADPQFAVAWMNKGIMHVNLGQYPDALAAFEKAFTIDSQYEKARNKHRLITRYLEGKYDEVIAIDASFAAAWLGKGRQHQTLKQYTEALDAYGQALALDPNYGEAKLARAAVFFIQKRYDEAIADDPNFASAWLAKGLGHKERRQYKPALLALATAARLNPSFLRTVQLNEANILLSQEKYSEAWRLFRALSAGVTTPRVEVARSAYLCRHRVGASVFFWKC